MLSHRAIYRAGWDNITYSSLTDNTGLTQLKYFPSLNNLKMKLKTTLLCTLVFVFVACKKTIDEELQIPASVSKKNDIKNGDAYVFKEVGSIDIGDLGAAEISTFDPKTNRLFVVNNSSLINKIDVLDFSNPSSPVLIGSISMAPYGGAVNSVDAKDGLLAAAIE